MNELLQIQNGIIDNIDEMIAHFNFLGVTPIFKEHFLTCTIDFVEVLFHQRQKWI